MAFLFGRVHLFVLLVGGSGQVGLVDHVVGGQRATLLEDLIEEARRDDLAHDLHDEGEGEQADDDVETGVEEIAGEEAVAVNIDTVGAERAAEGEAGVVRVERVTRRVGHGRLGEGATEAGVGVRRISRLGVLRHSVVNASRAGRLNDFGAGHGGQSDGNYESLHGCDRRKEFSRTEERG